jgi:RNA methyltransferase, TrmH family
MIPTAELKHISSLKVPKYRDLHQLSFAEGDKLLRELLFSGYPCEQVYATSAWIDKHDEMARKLSGKLVQCTEKELERMSALKSPQGVLAIIPVRQHTLPLHDCPLTLFCDRITDPGNMGTILRNADWFGIGQVVSSPGSVNIFNPKVVQASMGSVFRVHHATTTINQLTDAFRKKPEVYAAVMNGEPLPSEQPNFPAIIVLGNESEGISSDVLNRCTRHITIPRPGLNHRTGTSAESLNAGVASALLLYHFAFFNG